MAKRRTFVAALISLVCAFVLFFSLGMMTACGNDETAKNDETKSGAWYYGEALPSDSLGENGDYYLDTTTLASYIKDGQVWRLAASGEAGKLYYGTETPDSSLGALNDLYLNTATSELYQKKTAASWEVVLTLKGADGAKGRDGVIWYSGEGEPGSGPFTPTDAVKGDFYIDTTNWQVYQLQESDIWLPLGSIEGTGVQDVTASGNKLTVTLTDGTKKEFTFASCIGEHSYGEEEIPFVEPTCGRVGATLITCTVCHNVTLKTIPATGRHTYDESGSCTVCGAESPFSGEVSGDKYEIKGTEEADATELYIPGKMGEKTVEVAANAFSGNKTIESVVIGDGATIGSNAFYGTTSLKSVTFEGKASLKGSSFWGSGIQELDLSGDITFGTYDFTNCSSLTTLHIGTEVKALSQYMFNGCSALRTVTIDEGSQISAIPDSAFNGCESLTSIKLPTSVTSIGAYAFSSCKSLREINGLDNVTTIGMSAFYTYDWQHPESATGCLQAINAPCVTNVGNQAFYGQVELETANIGYNAASTKWGTSVFYECAALKTVYICANSTFDPYTTSNLRNLSFYGCDQLTDLYFNTTHTDLESKKESFAPDIKELMGKSTVTVHCTDG